VNYAIQSEIKNTYLSPEWASINLNQLANTNVVGYIGPLTNENTSAYLDVLEKNIDSKPLVSYGASS
jgi:hypothetical protein